MFTSRYEAKDPVTGVLICLFFPTSEEANEFAVKHSYVYPEYKIVSLNAEDMADPVGVNLKSSYDLRPFF